MVQVPAVSKETIPPEIEQTDEAASAIVNSTVTPEAPPVAAGVYAVPSTVALAGAEDVKAIFCAALFTVTLTDPVGES